MRTMSSIPTAIAGAFPSSVASRRRFSLLCTRSSASLSPHFVHVCIPTKRVPCSIAQIWNFRLLPVCILYITAKLYTWWVRHAQGIHNVEGDDNYKAYMSPEYFDAELTPLGWQQVDNLRKHVHSSGLSKRIELVITSPLTRTMQTAVGVFAGVGYTADGMHSQPLMLANAGNNNHSAISSLNCPPIVAVELCREHLGVHPCDKRRNISEYRHLFPSVDFSLVESEEDILWKADVREKKKDLAARGMEFFNWLLTRKEREIAVVSHNGFLFHTLSQFGDECHPSMLDEIRKSFRNCELRSVVIADRRRALNIPNSPDVPSKAADGKGIGESIAGSFLWEG